MISESAADEPLEFNDEIKIFYCSRTHSQLSQFANEVRRVKIPRSLEDRNDGNNDSIEQSDKLLVEGIKHLTLASRKNLCINDDVLKLGSATAINERCLELQQSKTADRAKCSFLPNKENVPLVHDFRDHTLATIRDIEDLGQLGRRIGICPYYASRAVIKPSEIVTLPYPLLLQKSAREALDLSLKDHIVVIDEAHNLMDAISNIYSTTVTLNQLKRARAQLGIYLQKFKNRLKGKNRVYIAQILRLIDSLATYLESKVSQSKSSDGIVSVSDLMSGKGVDQINLFKLSHYLQQSKLARKVDGYIVHTEDSNLETQKTQHSVPALTHVGGFFLCLTYPAAEGRFFYAKDEKDISLKYLLLDPIHHFKNIVDDARAVILAGGTMSPVSVFLSLLDQADIL